MTEAKDRIIVALDVETANEAAEAMAELRGHVGAFKIGLQLFVAAGPDFVRKAVADGTRIFLDLKFHDIPNTVAKASVEAARLGVWMFNVHAAGGSEMMKRAAFEMAEICDRERIVRPLMIAVTVLTSSTESTLLEAGITTGVDSQVLKLAKLTSECGLDGVVASPREIGLIRDGIGRQFEIVTPGIRPAVAKDHGFETSDDQQRVMTAAEAISRGADHIVVGRPIMSARDRQKAAAAIAGEIEKSLVSE